MHHGKINLKKKFNVCIYRERIKGTSEKVFLNEIIVKHMSSEVRPRNFIETTFGKAVRRLNRGVLLAL